MSHRTQIFDTTLRDGERAPWTVLPPQDQAEIAVELERLGADVIEVGFPGAGQDELEGVRAVAAEALSGARRSRLHASIATRPADGRDSA